MKKYFFIILICITSTSLAETIKCKGITNNSNFTIMPFEVEIIGKESVYFPGQKHYSSTIRYSTPNSGLLVQGFDVSSKLRRKNDKIIFQGSKERNSLELSFVGSSIETAILNSRDAGIDQVQVTCESKGKLPQTRSCSDYKDVNVSLVSAVKDVRDIDLLESIIECGADVNFKDKNLCTPIMFTVDSTCGSEYPNMFAPYKQDRSQFIDLLLNNAAYGDLADKNGETALIKATKNKIPDVYESFLAAEADFNAQDKKGNTPLMYASLTNDPYFVKDILAGNPDRTIKNKLNQNAYEFAKHWGMDKVLDLLKAPEREIRISEQADGTCSPLLIEATQNELVEIVLESSNTMLKFAAEKLDIEIMASAGSSDKKVVSFDSVGEFEFTCGPHHGGTPSQGVIRVR